MLDREHMMWSQRIRLLILPWAVAAMVTFSLFATFAEGQRRGMDHVATYGPISEQRSIAVAISDLVYKLRLGYIGYVSVLDKLQAVWDQGAKNRNDDPVLITNSKNAEILNSAIAAAASLGPQPPAYLSDHTLFTMYYDDLGYVDFVKYAFRLFGLKIEAMYYLFFTTLGLSALAFLIAFRFDSAALAVLLANVFVFLIEIHVGDFSPSMPTFAGMRHGSTLGLLPMWHFLFLTVRRSRPSILNVTLAIVQLLVLILAIKTRGSASWMVLFVVAVAVVVAVWPWLRSSAADRSWTLLHRLLVQWPVLLLLAGLFANAQFMKITLHQAYFTDDATPYHTLWHSIYTSWIWFDRSNDPASPSSELTSPYVRSMMAKGAQNDSLGYYAALEYLRDTHFMASDATTLEGMPPGLQSTWSYLGDIKWRLYDETIRHVVFNLALKHPIPVLRIIFITGPAQVVSTVVTVLKSAPSRIWMLMVLLNGLVMAAVQASTGRVPPLRDFRAALSLAGAATLLSGLINIIAISAPHTIADLLLSLLIFLQIVFWSAGGLIWRSLTHQRMRSAIAASVRARRERE
jgi:hypothetical protein